MPPDHGGIQHGPLPEPVDNEWQRVFGPAGSDHSFTVRNEVDCFDIRLGSDRSAALPSGEGRHAYVYAFEGSVDVGGVGVSETESVLWTGDDAPTVTAATGAIVVAFLIDPDAPVTRQGSIRGQATRKVVALLSASRGGWRSRVAVAVSVCRPDISVYRVSDPDTVRNEKHTCVSRYNGIAMDVALITVGDELLSGDTVNTNANWLASELSDRGVAVARILSVPDDRAVIAERVRGYAGEFDAVIVTGGIGGTPDDVTMEAVADAFDRDLAATDLTREAVERRLAEIRERIPAEQGGIDVDVEAEAAVPAESRPLLNEAGLAPGCVCEGVYVMPGIPDELKAMFDSVADEFVGDRRSRFLYTVEPEANIVPALTESMERFDVVVGCYPDREADHNRLKLTATDSDALAAAVEWLLETIDASETPVSRGWADDE